jgi:hypothetical protein
MVRPKKISAQGASRILYTRLSSDYLRPLLARRHGIYLPFVWTRYDSLGKRPRFLNLDVNVEEKKYSDP